MRASTWIPMAGALAVYAPLAMALEGDGTIARVSDPPPLGDLSNLPGDLRAIEVPGPSNLAEFVEDEAATIALGKALFWDMQVGADGIQACASCHFRAGADPRSKNQINPGLRRDPDPDFAFATGGPNFQLLPDMFPLTRLATPGVRGQLDPTVESDDVVSSQGVPFLAMGPDPLLFQVAGIKTRRVEPRNTPTVINAVFNHRQFWDGRADNVFNGVNPMGARDPHAKVLRALDKHTLVEVRVELEQSSLASQAVAPIVGELEMAAPGGTTHDVLRDMAKRGREHGKRLSNIRPLAGQLVHPSDSVLGAHSRWPQPGLGDKYEKMIQAAFRPEWWNSNRRIYVAPDGWVTVGNGNHKDPEVAEYRLAEYNFALFFGIAVQMYEATLVADDTPWDRFRRQHPDPTDPALNPWVNTSPDHISRLALFGAHLFNDRSRGPSNIRCSNCHEQAELTDASVRRITTSSSGPIRNRDGNIIDKGFNNIGVRPTRDDLGVGGSDVLGPLSFARRAFPDGLPESFGGADVDKGFGVEGAFKIPSLRNVALTAPYFHNGEARTLREVIELYSRGGNVHPVGERDGSPIEPLGVPALAPGEIDALVAWLESLTDERVLYRRAPFDHPQLFVPNGHPGDENGVLDGDGDGYADDVLFELPAVGAQGGDPIPGFLEGPFGPSP